MKPALGRFEPLIFAGTATALLGHLQLSRREAAVAEVIPFSEGSIFVRIDENVRGRNMFVAVDLFPANGS